MGNISSKAKRQTKFLQAYLSNNFNISASCRDAEVGRTSFYRWMETKRFASKFEEARESRKDFIESQLMGRIKADDTTAIIFACKTLLRDRGYIQGHRQRVASKPSAEAIEILENLINGEIDVRTAALKFEMAGLPLPKSIEVQIRKVVDEDGTPSDSEFPSDDELEAEYQETMAALEKEVQQFLPERRVEVEKLKDDIEKRDSFSKDEIENRR
jgi:antitoxin component of RelBE/YafQ-DinJ toxin-antitoxin module